jgi:hypothetical protein
MDLVRLFRVRRATRSRSGELEGLRSESFPASVQADVRLRMFTQ